jgi:hypothetical protein
MFLLAKSCSGRKEDLAEIKRLSKYEHTVKQYTTKGGTTIDYNKNLEVAIKSLIATQDTLLDYVANLELKIKDVHSSTIITERLKLDTLEIPVLLTECDFDTTIRIDSTHYNMDITVTNSGLRFNSLEFPNRSGITIADKRTKWYKRKERIVTVTNSNPFMQTEGITSYTLKQNNKWYEKWWVQAIGGGILGSIVTYKILK